MDQERLAKLVTDRKIQRTIIGKYKGAFSLGVTAHPTIKDAVAFVLRVEGDPDRFPDSIVIDGEEVTIVKYGNYYPPKPL